MKLIKMFGLAMLAAVAAMAIAGVGSASAQTHDVVLCKTNPGAEELCATGGFFGAGTLILGEALSSPLPPVLLGNIDEECDKSHVAGQITSSGGLGTPTLLGKIESLTFTQNCSPCNKVTIAVPIEVHVSMVSTNLYAMTALNPLATLAECTFGVSCGFKASQVVVHLQNAGDGSILALADKEALTRYSGSFLCGSTGEWDAHYVDILVKDKDGKLLNAWLALHKV